jgi:hypothetical protein
MTTDEKMEAIASFENAAAAFDDVLLLPPASWTFRPFPDAWTTHEHIVHCLEVDAASFHRYRGHRPAGHPGSFVRPVMDGGAGLSPSRSGRVGGVDQIIERIHGGPSSNAGGPGLACIRLHPFEIRQNRFGKRDSKLYRSCRVSSGADRPEHRPVESSGEKIIGSILLSRPTTPVG